MKIMDRRRLCYSHTSENPGATVENLEVRLRGEDEDQVIGFTTMKHEVV